MEAEYVQGLPGGGIETPPLPRQSSEVKSRLELPEACSISQSPAPAPKALQSCPPADSANMCRLGSHSRTPLLIF